jgi:hypothetical protein
MASFRSRCWQFRGPANQKSECFDNRRDESLADLAGIKRRVLTALNVVGLSASPEQRWNVRLMNCSQQTLKSAEVSQFHQNAPTGSKRWRRIA